MHIDPRSIPARQSVDGEGVPQIVGTRANASSGRFQPGAAKQDRHNVRGCRGPKGRSVATNEQRVGGSSACVRPSSSEVADQRPGERRMERHPTRTALALVDPQCTSSGIEIAQPEPHRLTEPNTRAVEDEEQCPVRRRAKTWRSESLDEMQERPDVLFVQDVRQEP